ncbi:hypothetical protein GPALN_005119 [Globodera pallida]|nr:hypothetical protein GPALN_005119 [Globodera pallida]
MFFISFPDGEEPALTNAFGDSALSGGASFAVSSGNCPLNLFNSVASSVNVNFCFRISAINSAAKRTSVGSVRKRDTSLLGRICARPGVYACAKSLTTATSSGCELGIKFAVDQFLSTPSRGGAPGIANNNTVKCTAHLMPFAKAQVASMLIEQSEHLAEIRWFGSKRLGEAALTTGKARRDIKLVVYTLRISHPSIIRSDQTWGENVIDSKLIERRANGSSPISMATFCQNNDCGISSNSLRPIPSATVSLCCRCLLAARHIPESGLLGESTANSRQVSNCQSGRHGGDG